VNYTVRTSKFSLLRFRLRQGYGETSPKRSARRRAYSAVPPYFEADQHCSICVLCTVISRNRPVFDRYILCSRSGPWLEAPLGSRNSGHGRRAIPTSRRSTECAQRVLCRATGNDDGSWKSQWPGHLRTSPKGSGDSTRQSLLDSAGSRAHRCWNLRTTFATLWTSNTSLKQRGATSMNSRRRRCERSAV
jgi:hypothetical protein